MLLIQADSTHICCTNSSSFNASLAKLRMPSANFSVAMGSSFITLAVTQLFHQFGGDSQQVAPCQFQNLIDVAKARTHYDSSVVVPFIVVVNPGNRLDTWILRSRVTVNPSSLLVAVKDWSWCQSAYRCRWHQYRRYQPLR